VGILRQVQSEIQNFPETKDLVKACEHYMAALRLEKEWLQKRV